MWMCSFEFWSQKVSIYYFRGCYGRVRTLYICQQFSNISKNNSRGNSEEWATFPPFLERFRPIFYLNWEQLLGNFSKSMSNFLATFAKNQQLFGKFLAFVLATFEENISILWLGLASVAHVRKQNGGWLIGFHEQLLGSWGKF